MFDLLRNLDAKASSRSRTRELIIKPTVIAVCSSSAHKISKDSKSCVDLLAGLGVEDDAHLGKTTQHLHLLKKDPGRPNLSQVHLLHEELHDHLNEMKLDISPGLMGENITTRGVELMALPQGTRLHIGKSAIVELTGYRQPCSKLNKLRPGLMDAVFLRNQTGCLVPNAGVMAVVIKGGQVRPSDHITIKLPGKPHCPLSPV
jgi:MOSC domain-containing protein YiiM